MLLFSIICCVNALEAAVFNMLLLHLSMRGGYMENYYLPCRASLFTTLLHNLFNFAGFKLQPGWKTVDPH